MTPRFFAIDSPMKREEGFSLVEVMVSSGLLIIGILGLAFMQVKQRSTKSDIDVQNLGRREMERLVGQIIADPYRFPYFENGAGQGVVYVACFDITGAPLETAATASLPNRKEFVGTFLIDPNSAAFFSSYTATPICTQNWGGFEMHVAPVPAPTDNLGSKISVAVIALDNTTGVGGKSAVQSFKTTLRLSGPTSWANPFGNVRFSGRWCLDSDGGCKAGTTDCVIQNWGTVDYDFCY